VPRLFTTTLPCPLHPANRGGRKKTFMNRKIPFFVALIDNASKKNESSLACLVSSDREKQMKSRGLKKKIRMNFS
jgi:hypothetical protein